MSADSNAKPGGSTPTVPPGAPPFPSASSGSVPAGMPGAPLRPADSPEQLPSSPPSTVAGAPAPTSSPPEPLVVRGTRTSATYIGVAVGLLILVLIIIFVAQNLNKASVHFLSFNFRTSLGLLILAAAVAGGLLVFFVSLARVLQLRLMARRHRRAYDHA